MLIALQAAAAMVVQDILATLLTQAEARNRAKLSGLLDSLMWLAGIWTTDWALIDLNGHSSTDKIAVLVLVSAANYGGTVAGTKIGERWIKVSGRLAEHRR